MTTTNKSLLRFLRTKSGQRCVAAYVGVRSTDPALHAQATELALHWAPNRELRSWTMADLRDAALRVDGADVYRAREDV